MKQVLSAGLGPKWTAPVQEAWLWLWGWLTESMAVMLQSASTNASLIQVGGWHRTSLQMCWET